MADILEDTSGDRYLELPDGRFLRLGNRKIWEIPTVLLGEPRGETRSVGCLSLEYEDPPWPKKDSIWLTQEREPVTVMGVNQETRTVYYQLGEDIEHLELFKFRGAFIEEPSQTILLKVRLLLNKSRDPGCSQPEAEAAAQKAQQLLTQYRLQEADLPNPGQEVEGIHEDEIPLHVAPHRAVWISKLVSSLCDLNGCRYYYTTSTSIPNMLLGGRVQEIGYILVGTASDRAIVRELFKHFVLLIEQAKEAANQGYGRTWTNNFRLGMVTALSKRMKAGHHVAVAAATSTAIVRLDERQERVKSWTEENLDLGKGSQLNKSYAQDRTAWQQGYSVGSSIPLPETPT
jgi:hypothetical protein